jgi:hypothetical protein
MQILNWKPFPKFQTLEKLTSKTKKQMTTRSKLHLENPMQPAATNCSRTQPSCTLHGEIVCEHDSPARCTRTLFANTALLQSAQHLCRHAKASCNHATGICKEKSIKITNISNVSLKFLPS